MPLFTMLLAAAVASPPALAPVGPWVVQVEESMCLLQRGYPVGDKKITLVFQPLLDLDSMDMYIMTDDRSSRQYTGTFINRQEPGSQSWTGKYFSVKMPTDQMRLTRLSAERQMLEQLKDGDILQVQAKPVNIAFRIVRPEKARVALKGCIDNLKKRWGVNPEVAAQVATPLEGNPARYFNAGSYPMEAERKGIYGRVIALLNVNTAGAVDHCRIVSSAGADLNDGTCAVAKQIRFKPARDKNGTALPSTYILPVRWSLPGAPD
jgi:TonB family protein